MHLQLGSLIASRGNFGYLIENLGGGGEWSDRPKIYRGERWLMMINPRSYITNECKAGSHDILKTNGSLPTLVKQLGRTDNLGIDSGH